MRKERIMKWGKELVVTLMLVVLFTTIAGLLRAPDTRQLDFRNLQATALHGKKIDLRHFRGRPFVLHFWATWCPVCKTEIDNIQRICRTYPVVTVAVSSKKIEAFMKEHGFDFTVIDDASGRLASKFGITLFPTTLFIDPSGKVAFAESGYTTTLGLWLRLWYLGFVRG